MTASAGTGEDSARIPPKGKGLFWFLIPALTGWARLCHAYGVLGVAPGNSHMLGRVYALDTGLSRLETFMKIEIVHCPT
jgi:hypothetical protein